MGVTVEHNTGDPELQRDVIAIIEHVLSDRPGDWRVSIIGSQGSDSYGWQRNDVHQGWVNQEFQAGKRRCEDIKNPLTECRRCEPADQPALRKTCLIRHGYFDYL